MTGVTAAVPRVLIAEADPWMRDLLTQAATTPRREDVVARILARSERSRVSAAEILRAERDDRSTHP